MARYRKLDLRTWNDQKFRELSPLPPSGQSLWLFLILGPQTTNIPGLFEASEVAMADRLGWPLEAFRKAFKEASDKGMAKADWQARLVWLPKAPEYNKPESPNVVKSWGTTFDELPECALKWEAYQALKAFTKGLKKAFHDAFNEAFPKPSGKAMPNQEQEQEQKQEQEQIHKSGNGVNGSERGSEKGRYPPDFDHHAEFKRRVLERYPKTTHVVNEIVAQQHCMTLIEVHGLTWEDIGDIVDRFRAWVKAGGRSSPRYVEAPQTLLSPSGNLWKQPFDPPPSDAEVRLESNVDAAAQAKRELLEESRR